MTFAMSVADIDLTGLTRLELADKLSELGISGNAVKPIWNGIYIRGFIEFSQIEALSRTTQSKLAEHFTIGRPTVTRELMSNDGTRKWLLKWKDHQEVESVFIPEKDRGALCR